MTDLSDAVSPNGTQPIPGPLFRRAAAVKIEGTKRRRLFCLLAAYIDAGQRCPRARDLASRLGVDVAMLDHLLGLLEREKLIKVIWAPKSQREEKRWRNTYYLKALGDKRSKDARAKARRRARAKAQAR